MDYRYKLSELKDLVHGGWRADLFINNKNVGTGIFVNKDGNDKQNDAAYSAALSSAEYWFTNVTATESDEVDLIPFPT